jgi:hypothetical protein
MSALEVRAWVWLEGLLSLALWIDDFFHPDQGSKSSFFIPDAGLAIATLNECRCAQAEM